MWKKTLFLLKAKSYCLKNHIKHTFVQLKEQETNWNLNKNSINASKVSEHPIFKRKQIDCEGKEKQKNTKNSTDWLCKEISNNYIDRCKCGQLWQKSIRYCYLYFLNVVGTFGIKMYYIKLKWWCAFENRIIIYRS